MQTLIAILLILIWSCLLFGGGFFTRSIFLQQANKSETINNNYSIDNQSNGKEITPERQREAEKLKKQMENFFAYNGEEQEEITID